MTELAQRIGRSFKNFASGGLNLLFPPRCVCCHDDLDLSDAEDHILICQECRRRIAPEKWVGCRHCGGTLSGNREPSEHCSLCKHPPLLFDRVVVMGGYHDSLRDVILRMKHPRQEALSLAMGRLLGEKRFSELSALAAEVIVPIPMYWFRRLRRGTNSAELLACELGKKMGLPVIGRLLVRTRNTLPQVGLPPSRRFHNMKGAFHVRSKAGLNGTRILLVDDVLTTGATCSEAAGALKKAGASMVAVAVAARAQGKE
jgi:competence protein ComFC